MKSICHDCKGSLEVGLTRIFPGQHMLIELEVVLIIPGGEFQFDAQHRKLQYSRNLRPHVILQTQTEPRVREPPD